MFAFVCQISPSLGGSETLIEQPLVMSYFECTPEQRQSFGITDNMIRIACGLENTSDLVTDLDQALSSSSVTPSVSESAIK